MYDKLVDMAKTGPEMEDEDKPSKLVYPYNLCITLCHDELEKLGLDIEDEEAQVGNYIHGTFLAEVTGIHKNKTQDGEESSVNLQITHLSLSSDEDDGEKEENETAGFPSYGG